MLYSYKSIYICIFLGDSSGYFKENKNNVFGTNPYQFIDISDLNLRRGLEFGPEIAIDHSDY